MANKKVELSVYIINYISPGGKIEFNNLPPDFSCTNQYLPQDFYNLTIFIA